MLLAAVQPLVPAVEGHDEVDGLQPGPAVEPGVHADDRTSAALAMPIGQHHALSRIASST